jgi:hypothetical protein
MKNGNKINYDYIQGRITSHGHKKLGLPDIYDTIHDMIYDMV